jgi:hypothetical protein
MRWIALLLLLSGCDWYAPELQACHENSYCPEGFQCAQEENEDTGFCERSPDGDDDDSADDDDFADDDDSFLIEEGVTIERPVANSTLWIAEGLHFEAIIGFPEQPEFGRSIVLSLNDEELWFDDDVDGWEVYSADSSRVGGWIAPGAWTAGPATVSVSATAGSWWQEEFVNVELAVLPDGWIDGDGDGWCPGEGTPPGSGVPPGNGGRDDDHDGVCDTEERSSIDLFDCDDTDSVTRPEGEEACDGIDTDCDGELGPKEFDGDGDGAMGCIDCDDTDAAIHEGAAEVCDGVDNDCDGRTDEHEDEGDSGEVTAEQFSTLLEFTRTAVPSVGSCPAAFSTLPTCSGDGPPLCTVGASTTGAFSSPEDGLDAWRFSWPSTSGLSAVGCPTTVTVAPAVGQPLDAELWILPEQTAPLVDWLGPLPLAPDADGVLSLTFDESLALLAGSSFEDVDFVVSVSPTNGLAQCPTDGYTLTVEGY